MTILSTPATYASAQDDLIYTVYDDHVTDSATYPNYKYIADVYVNGELAATLRKVQDPVTGIGIFNIGQIVRSYLTPQFSPSAGLFVCQAMGEGEFYANVVVKFGEEYDSVSYLEVANDTARDFFNHYNGRLLGVSSDLSEKINKLTTRNPLYGPALFASSFYLVPYFPTSTSSVTVTVTPFGSGSGFSTSFTPTGAYELQILNLAPEVFNGLHAGSINSATTYYTVQVGAQTYRINLVCEPMYDSYMVHFLNKYGGFESKLFSKVSRNKIEISRKDFGKLRYTVDGSGIPSYANSNGVYNESKSVFSSQYKEKLELNSDLLTDAEYVWLQDLLVSPMVYIQTGAYFYPCVITDNTYESKKVVNDDLTNLVINVEYGQTLNAQYR